MAIADLSYGSLVSNTGWTNPLNGGASDNAYATCTLASSVYVVELEDVPADFGSLNSVTLAAEWSLSGTASRSKSIMMELIDPAGNVLHTFSTPSTTNQTADTTHDSGALASSLDAAALNAARLRVTMVEGGGMADSVTVRLDRAWVTLNYEVAAAGPVEGGSSSAVGVASAGAGEKIGQDGASSAVGVSDAGAGSKTGEGGASSAVQVAATGGGSVIGGIPEGGSTAAVGVAAAGGGTKMATGGSTAPVVVTSAGGGAPVAAAPEGGSAAPVSVAATGGGEKTAEGGAGAAVGVSAAGAGAPVSDVPFGGADAPVRVAAAGAGEKIATGGGTAGVAFTATADAVKVAMGGATVTVLILGQWTPIGAGARKTIATVRLPGPTAATVRLPATTPANVRKSNGG